MKLYYSPGACSLSPHIVLQELGLPYTPVLASTKSHKLQDGTDFYTINPLGYVPLLELDDGKRLHEGPAIVQYLADQAPDKKLAPANGTWERYKLQEWLTFIGTELHKSFSPLFNPASTDDVKNGARERITGRLQFVENELAGKQYLMGEQFTVADAYLFTVTNWAKLTGVDLSGFPNLNQYRERVGARPAVVSAMKAEGLIK
ncbi:glutathione transferase GstA [Diaphorobacter ruginosibacter]|uniref:Glutathione transferase GstA n=1 Tax=Diaphorobacter ruginosibacter TaxID=1715720 RepID=A0A7G9RMJ2_9BURK|nr:glutathione transferase GstA [Diaphorobacter ruginosibacter]QNN56817.1 glutathione transferase GstA [Diaphorobacter ruginosibacter]